MMRLPPLSGSHGARGVTVAVPESRFAGWMGKAQAPIQRQMEVGVSVGGVGGCQSS